MLPAVKLADVETDCPAEIVTVVVVTAGFARYSK
jgi:hypothetical protein